jgi:hypothetical protein
MEPMYAYSLKGNGPANYATDRMVRQSEGFTTGNSFENGKRA